MSKELLEATKKAMGYVDEAPTCENCKFHSEEELYSRSWIDICNYSNLATFLVNKKGICNKFINKNAPDSDKAE